MLGCSGGPDSQAMAHAWVPQLLSQGTKVEIAAVDHGVRAEAGAEIALVARSARELGVPFHSLSVTLGSKGSLQAEAREQRYRALLDLRQDRGLDVLAVGHTRDDQAETVVMRLFNGADVPQLAAIQPRREDGVIRPLLDCSREEILAYLNHHRLNYAQDPSNTAPRFERVTVRQEVLPALEASYPKAREHLAKFADRMRSLGREQIGDSGDPEDSAPRFTRQQLQRVPMVQWQAVLRQWVYRVSGEHLSTKQWAQLESLLDGMGPGLGSGAERQRRIGGEVWLPRSWSVHVSAQGLELKQRDAIPHESPARAVSKS